VATSTLAGYAFARLRFPGRHKLFFGYLATLMIPQAVIMIPVFVILRTLGWIDTYKALILPGLFTAYGTFMLRQFFMSIPRDLEEAAMIDGCGPLKILWHVIVPVSKPAITTLAILTFMANWRSFMWPRIVIHSLDKSTIPVGLQAFQTLHATEYTLLMAGSVMALIPVIIVFVIGQKALVKGILLGAVKG
jgi:multiple sugar transport system permease protein